MFWRTNENSDLIRHQGTFKGITFIHIYISTFFFKSQRFFDFGWDFFICFGYKTREALYILGICYLILLQDAGGFNYVSRETTHPKLPEGMKTYWLIGLTGGGETTVITATTETKSNA